MYLFQESTDKFELDIIISIISAVIALYAAYQAKKSLNENKRITKINGNIDLLSDSLSMLENQPELLGLHGVTNEELEKNDISKIELIYIMNSLNAAYYYYLIGDNKDIDINNFSEYRKNFLSNPKVEKCWKEIIKPKFTNEGEFTKAVDKFYSK